MAELPAELARRIDLVAADRASGASEVLEEVLAILREAAASATPLRPVARALVQAQPSMAPVWNAVLEAMAGEHDPTRFERFVHRVRKAPDTMARFGVECLAAGDPAGLFDTAQGRPLRLVTLSLSRSVITIIDAVCRIRPVRLCCSESRPALEGRRLAARIASLGVPVTCFSDAAIGHALAAAEAVLLGADAIGPEWFLNKSGSRMLAAAAQQQGVPVYVAATRDKFVGHAVGARLVIREAAPEEIWQTPPPGVDVRNPYFESTPLDMVTTVISDVGLLGAGMVPDVCQSIHDPLLLAGLEEVAE